MTRGEILRMARDADDFRGLWNEQRHIGDIQDFLCRFAALVEQRAAAAEREACAQIAEEWFARVVAAAIRARDESWRETNRQTGETT